MCHTCSVVIYRCIDTQALSLIIFWIDRTSPGARAGIDAVADSVAHVRFVGTDWASDEVVLMKMLQVVFLICEREIGRTVDGGRDVVVAVAVAIIISCF